MQLFRVAQRIDNVPPEFLSYSCKIFAKMGTLAAISYQFLDHRTHQRAVPRLTLIKPPQLVAVASAFKAASVSGGFGSAKLHFQVGHGSRRTVSPAPQNRKAKFTNMNVYPRHPTGVVSREKLARKFAAGRKDVERRA